MTAFLAQLGKSLADRWLSLMVLPGLLWTAAVLGAYHLGQAHPFLIRVLTFWLNHLTASPTAHQNGAIAVAVTGILLASGAAGLAAGGLGTAVQHLWGAPGGRPPLSWLLTIRKRRWERIRETARRAVGAATDPALTGKARTRADAKATRTYRRSLARPHSPQRPTLIAERFHATAERTRALYGLEVDLVWPRLWTVLPDSLRTDIKAAGDSYSAAARLGGWALLYTVLVVFWWPAAGLGAVIAGAATVKARAAAQVLADLVDTAVDLHLAELADRLLKTPPTPDTGEALKKRLTRPGSAPGPGPGAASP